MSTQVSSSSVTNRLKLPPDRECNRYQSQMSREEHNAMDHMLDIIVGQDLSQKQILYHLLLKSPYLKTRRIEIEQNLSLQTEFCLGIDHSIAVRDKVILKGARVVISEGTFVRADEVEIYSLAPILGAEQIKANKIATYIFGADRLLDFVSYRD